MLNPPPSNDIDTNSFAYKQWFYMLWTSVSTTVVSAANSFIQLGVGAVTRTMQDKARDIVNVKDFGAVGDGIINDTAAIQTAINAVAILGGLFKLEMAAGVYNITAPLVISGPIWIDGRFNPGQAMTTSPTTSLGTMLKFNHTGRGFVVTGTGFTCTNLGVYRPQATPGAGWTPYASDWDFYLDSIDTTLDNILFWGSRRGIILNSGGRLNTRNIKGQFFDAGIQVVSATDTVRIADTHMYTIWNSDSNVIAYMLANLITTEFRRCDGVMMSNFFSIQHNKAIYFNHDVSGDTTNFKGSNLYLDNGTTGIETSATTSGVTAQFSNVNYAGSPSAGAGYGIRLLGNAAVIGIVNFQSTYSGASVARNADGTSNYLFFSGSIYITNWNATNGGFGGIHTAGTGNITSIGNNALVGVALVGATAAFTGAGAGERQGAFIRKPYSLTTNASGDIAIAHGIGRSPSSADVSIDTFNNYSVHIASIDATNFVCRVYNGTTALVTTAVTGSFTAYY